MEVEILDVHSSNSKKEQFVEHIVPSLEELNEVPQSEYKCDMCSVVVRTKANLKAHRIKTHKILETQTDYAFYSKKKSTVCKMFHCPAIGCKYIKKTGFGFKKFSHLKQHYQWVHGEKLYVCTACSRSFPTQASLACHVRSCGEIYVCPLCHRSYKERKNLRSHQRRAHDGSSSSSGYAVHNSVSSEAATQCFVSSQSTVACDNNSSSLTSSTPFNIFPLTSSRLAPRPHLSNSSETPDVSLGLPAQPPPPTQLLQPIYLPMVLPVSATNQHQVADFITTLSTLICRLTDSNQPPCNTNNINSDPQGTNWMDALLQFPPAQTAMPAASVSINAVPDLIGTGIQSSAVMLDSATQTEIEFYQLPLPPPISQRTVGIDLPFLDLPTMPSIGVSTDLSLGLDEFDAAFDFFSSSSTCQHQHHPPYRNFYPSNGSVGGSYNHLSTNTAMQTEGEGILLGQPEIHVETQTFPQLSYEDMGVGGHLCLQDFTDIETQTVDLESFFMLNSVQTQTPQGFKPSRGTYPL